MDETAKDRRNDIGYKTTLTIYTSVMAILLGLFIHSAWATANQGNIKAGRNEIKIASMEECVRNISEDIREIKFILQKEYIP